jgi:pantoate--beta-alanine ligase
VNKLFNIVQPDRAYFGQKDAQQAIIIERMVRDLNLPVKVKIMPTVRHPEGLALSSRNQYLNPEERRDAAVLYAALKQAKDLVKQGVKDAHKIIKAVKMIISEKKPTKIDYVSIVDLDNLKPIERIKDKALLALAVWFGNTRLIDNIILSR